MCREIERRRTFSHTHVHTASTLSGVEPRGGAAALFHHTPYKEKKPNRLRDKNMNVVHSPRGVCSSNSSIFLLHRVIDHNNNNIRSHLYTSNDLVKPTMICMFVSRLSQRHENVHPGFSESASKNNNDRLLIHSL